MKGRHMKRRSTFFLRAAVLAVGLVILALCVFALPAGWKAIPEENIDYDYALYAILAAMWTAALPFFYALYQTLKLLNYIDHNKAFSELSVKALKTIKYCGIAISLIFAATLPFFYVFGDQDDAPGVIVIGMALVVAPFGISVFAAVLQRLLQDAINIKSENDLTV